MQKYQSINNSGIEAYEIGDNYIKVKYCNSQKPYVYSFQTAGAQHIEEMKKLAKGGSGLNAYINKYVKDNYERIEYF